MNYGLVGHMLGWIWCFMGMFFSLPSLVGLIYREPEGWVYFLMALFCGAAGLLILRKKPKSRSMFSREGLVIVALSWILLSLLGAIPFVITGEIPSYIDAFFETVSGFTTTGSSILTNVEALSHTSLFWRSFTHWVGGMGVLVFIMAILPMKGNSNMYLMRAESPGPTVGKLVPKLRKTALILYAIYFTMTVVLVGFLLLGKMPLFDALCTAFGAAGTGGFGIKNDSMASYSPYLQMVTTIGMIAFGVNFGSYFLILKKKPKQAIQSTEVRWYLGIIAAATLIITISIIPRFSTVYEAFHHAFFQVGSIITTTGFATENFDLWPPIAKTILVMLMFIGACAGSTGGGIKVSRLIILLKGVKKEIGMVCHPRSIKKVKMDGRLIEHEVVRSVNSFIVLYVVIFAVSLLVISLDEKDLVTNFTAVATTLNNIGPGLSIVGPSGNFSSFSDLSKLVLSFNMLAGRLELIPMLMLFVPSIWKR